MKSFRTWFLETKYEWNDESTFATIHIFWGFVVRDIALSVDLKLTQCTPDPASQGHSIGCGGCLGTLWSCSF